MGEGNTRGIQLDACCIEADVKILWELVAKTETLLKLLFSPPTGCFVELKKEYLEVKMSLTYVACTHFMFSSLIRRNSRLFSRKDTDTGNNSSVDPLWTFKISLTCTVIVVLTGPQAWLQ